MVIKKDNNQLWTFVGMAVVVAIIASAVTVSVTGNLIRVSPVTKDIEQVYTKAEIDTKLKTIPTYDGVLQVMGMCETTGKSKIGLTRINNQIVGSANMDTCKEICGTTQKCLIGFLGEEDKSKEKHTLFGAVNCDGSRASFAGMNNYEVECICCRLK